MESTQTWLGQTLAVLLPLLLWCAWWLGGVNWTKAWPVLASGGWVPVLLLMAVATLAWSRIETDHPGWLALPNVWWQLVCVCGLVAIALFSGWLQGYFGWAPAEIDLEPPAHAGHGDAHAHH
jgi:hypothetical protein